MYENGGIVTVTTARPIDPAQVTAAVSGLVTFR